MTRKELVEEVKNRIGYETDNERYAMSESEREFYRSILNLLEQEPCEDCEFHKDSGCCKWSCVFEEVEP